MYSLKSAGTGLACQRWTEGGINSGLTLFFFFFLIMFNPIAWHSRRSKAFHLVSSPWSRCARSPPFICSSRRTNSLQIRRSGVFFFVFFLHFPRIRTGALCQVLVVHPANLCDVMRAGVSNAARRGENVPLVCDRQAAIIIIGGKRAWCTRDRFCTHKCYCINQYTVSLITTEVLAVDK